MTNRERIDLEAVTYIRRKGAGTLTVLDLVSFAQQQRQREKQEIGSWLAQLIAASDDVFVPVGTTEPEARLGMIMENLKRKTKELSGRDCETENKLARLARLAMTEQTQ